MDTKTLIVVIVIAVVAYIVGARYPAIAQKFGAAG